MTLALFDLDNTLLRGDSDHAWGEFMVEKGLVDGNYYRSRNDAFYEAYKRGQLDIFEYLDFALEPLTRFSLDELAGLHQEFMASKIAPMRLPAAEALIRKHVEAGHHPLIITATNRFVTEPIARSLGINTLIATDPERTETGYTGKVSGTPCYQSGKVTRLNEWLANSQHSLDGSYFYSDSINDLPLLTAVTHPVAVDPDDRLRNEAEQRGWPIISLRDTP